MVIQECETTVSKDEFMTESTRGAVVAFVSYAVRREGSVVGELSNRLFRTVGFSTVPLLTSPWISKPGVQQHFLLR